MGKLSSFKRTLNLGLWIKWRSASPEGKPVLLLILPENSLSFSEIASFILKRAKRQGWCSVALSDVCLWTPWDFYFSIEHFEWWSLTLQSSIWNAYQEPLFHYWMFLRNKERSLSVWAVIVFIRTISWSFRRCLIVTLLQLWRRRHSSLFS